MKVISLELSDFRNYITQSIELGEGVNVIFGDNAQGKTNILEAVYFFAMGKSNRARKDAELIRHGENRAYIKLEFADSERENILEAEIFSDKRKRILINEIPIRKNSELVRRFNVVYFGPENLGLVKEGPSVRRKNIDFLISQIKLGYLAALSDLKKIVESKNALLRMEHPNLTMLDIMDEKLTAVSVNIIMYRALYISRIERIAQEIQKDISNGAETLEIKYQSCIGDVRNMDLDAIKKTLADKIAESRNREIKLCESVIGPHREDIVYLINGEEAKLYASQGQQKTIVMSQKLAEVELMADEIGEKPVLLLDDIMSELDKTRREYILKNIENMQILITCTDLEGIKIPEDAVQIEVINGKAERI